MSGTIAAMARSHARLVLQAEITPKRFGEVGRPYRVVRQEADRLAAICSAFDSLYWPGRALYDGHALRHRIGLYSSDFQSRVAVFDAARFPVNDLAFHPSEPWLAIATGSYDGGYMFEGELLLWNWETGECRSLLGESREVACCRFVDAQRLAVLLRPRDEEEFGEERAFSTYVGVILNDLRPARELGLRDGDADPRLLGLEPIDPASLGFHAPEPQPALSCTANDLQLTPLGFERRHRVWDVAWLAPNRVAAVHDGCHVEVWGTSGVRELNVRGPGHGVQLLHHPTAVLVHVLERGDYLRGQPDRSKLLSLQGQSLIEMRSFDHAYAFSIDREGRVLARDTGDPRQKRARLDRVLDSSGNTIVESDFGHYDCFNHYLRIDGDEDLYFLRGTPPSSHQAKRLCAIDRKGATRELMLWDDQGEHLMDGSAARGPGDTIVRAYRVYHPNPTRSRGAIELHSFARGSLWRSDVEADVTALVVASDGGHIVFALTNGRFGVINMTNGVVVDDNKLTADGVPTVGTAIAARDRSFLVGTVDGRLLLYALVTG